MKRRKRHYQQIFAATFSLVMSFASLSQAAQAKKAGWLIRQNSQTYGTVKTIVSPDGLKMEMGTIRVTMTPPKWRITFWNERTKYIFDESLQEFQRRSPRKPRPSGYLERLEPGKPRFQTFSGLKAKNWHWYAYDPKNPKEQKLLYDFACAENLNLPQGLMDAASICCYIPTGKGLPLRVVGDSFRGTKVFLNTTFVSKTMVDPEIFKTPKNYTRVKSEMEVLLKESGTLRDEDVSDLYKPFPEQ
ncbi:MAG: hypothetical protein K2Y39_22830 [Candidatus Obscuribacterales bacterium]|nr:hypothetical protein [Candidatus Obscuribacterales bacterium]